MIYKELNEYLNLVKKNKKLLDFFCLDYSSFAYKIAKEMILGGTETTNDFEENVNFAYEAFVGDIGFMLPSFYEDKIISFAYKLWHECMDNERGMDPLDFLERTYGWLK